MTKASEVNATPRTGAGRALMEGALDGPGAWTLDDIRQTILAIEAEERRATVERIQAFADRWWNKSQEGHTVIRDAGIMQEMVTELRAILDAETER
jgi:hypothetical protein